MKKNLLLYILLGFLIIVNGFFLFQQFKPSDQNSKHGHKPLDFIVKELQFDATQERAFEKLNTEHRRKLRSILDEQKISKDALFDKLFDETVSPSVIDSITTLIAKKEKLRDLETFSFFKAISDLCNQNQKERLKSIIKDALHQQRPPRHKMPPVRAGDENRPPPPRP